MNKLKYFTFILAGITGLLLVAFSLVRAGVLAPPQVVDLQPDPGSHNVPVGSSVSITYDQDMDPATVDPQSFAVHARQTGWLTETLSVMSGTISLDPLNPFHAGELVQVSATTATLSLGAEAPLAPTVWQFNTAPWGGNAAFHEHQILVNDGSRDAALGDLDGDGDLDAFTVSCGYFTRVYHNNGSGIFIEAQNFSHPTHCFLDAELGDLNGDGDLDAVLIDLWDGGSRVMWNNGDGTFTEDGQFLGILNTYGELGDLDGDGDLDLFVAAGGYGLGILRVWKNDGAGHFTLASVFDSAYEHMGVALGDLDGDYDLDAFTAGWNSSYNKVWLNDSTGSFTQAQVISNTYTSGVQLGDLDGDGDLDVYLANNILTTGNIPDGVWLNDGTGYFTDSSQSLDTVFSVMPALGDLDADGDLDVYLAGDVNVGEPDEVWANDGTGTFSLFRTVAENHLGALATLGDLDGDGNLDVFTTSPYIGDGYRVYLNGDWTQATPIPVPWIGQGIQCPDDPEHYYLVGGRTTSQEINTVRRYDVQDNTWHELADLPIYNQYPSLACYQGKIYAAGGVNVGQGLLDTLYIYDIASNYWSPGADLPSVNVAAALGAWQGKLYLVGGNNTGGPWVGVSDVHMYDIASDTWTPNGGADMPVGSDFGGVVQAGPYLYVLGGLSGNFLNNLNTTQRYNMATDTWEQGPLFTSRRALTALAITEEYLYGIGGDANGGGSWDNATDIVERLDLSLWPGGTWTDINDPLPEALLTQSFCSESLTGGEIWAAGGFDVNLEPVDSMVYRLSEPCVSYGVELAPDSLAGEGYRSMSAGYTLTITNTGDITDHFSVVATGVWPVTVPAEIGPLGPGESAALPVSVAIPYEAALGDWDTAVVTATSLSNQAEWDSSTITTTAVTGWTAAQSVPMGVMGNLVQCTDQPNSFYLVSYADQSDTLWRFDADINDWTEPGELADMPAPRMGVAAACYQGKIYVAGGWSESVVYNSFFIYDIATDEWEIGPHLPDVIWSAALGAWDGRLYLVGGTRDIWPWMPVSRVDVYHINMGVWMNNGGAPMPTPASFFGSVQRGPFLYAVGGYSINPSQNVNQTQRYDMAANTWVAVDDFTSARAILSVAATRSHLYSLGGDLNPASGPHVFTDLVECMDLAAWPGAGWMNFDPMLRPFFQGTGGVCTTAMSGGEIWVVGGDEPSNLYHHTEPCLGYNYALTLTPATLDGFGDPGEIVPYTLTVTNTSDTPDAYDVLVTSTWPASVSPLAGALEPDESAELVVSVQIPAGAFAEEQDTATVTVVSQGDGSVSASSVLTTTALPVYGVELVAVDPTLFGFPGQVVTYTLHLTNTGNITDTIVVSYDGNLWEVTVPVTGFMLGSGESVDVVVLVSVPEDALADQYDMVTITVASQGDPGLSASAALTTTAKPVYGVELTTDDPDLSAFPNQVLTYTLHLTNTGNLTDTFEVSFDDNLWEVTVPVTSVLLASGETRDVIVTVAILGDVLAGSEDMVVITATSQGDPLQTAQVELTTTAVCLQVYLPVIRK